VRIGSSSVLLYCAAILAAFMVLSKTSAVAAAAQDPAENRVISNRAEQERAATLAKEAARRRDAAVPYAAPVLSHGKEPPRTPTDRPPPTPTAIVEQPRANILVGVRPQVNGAFRAGDSVRLNVVVENLGPSIATYVRVNQTLSNLTVQRVGGACMAPCSVTPLSGAGAVILRLAPGDSARIIVAARILASGPFRVDVIAESRVPDPDHFNNHGWFEGRALPLAAPPPMETTPQPAPTPSPPSPTPAPPPAPPPAESRPPDSTEAPTPQPEPPASTPVKPASPTAPATPHPAVLPASAAPRPFGSRPNSPAQPAPTLSLSMTLGPPGPYRPGQDVALDIRIRNIGRTPGQGIAIANTSRNLQIVAIAGACVALPCDLPQLPSGREAAIRLTGRINPDATAGFQDRLLVSTAGLRPGTLTVSADLPPPRNLTGLFLAVGAGLVALTVAVATSLTRVHWRRAIAVTASLDPHGRTAIGPLAPIGPALSVRSRIEMGKATASGPINIQRAT
jgi:hypothetical protein